MLGAIRNNPKVLKVILWFVILAFLATIVVVWGMGENQSGFGYAAKVGNKIIGVNEFQNYYRYAADQARQLGGDIPADTDMTKLVMNEIIERELLLTEADRLKVPVSDAEVVASITSNPLFFDNDSMFSVTKYQELLPIPAKQYEESVREDIKLNKMLELVYGTLNVNQDEIAKEYEYLNTRLSTTYFAVDPANYSTSEMPSTEELTAFYESNKERYRRPASIRLKYITFDKAEWLEATNFITNITDNDTQLRYTRDIALYSRPKQADLSAIFFPVAADANAKADEALAAINAGESFEDVAKHYAPGDTAFMGRISHTGSGSELEETIFSLKSGEHSQVMPSSTGFAIYKVDNVAEANITPYTDVKDIIRLSMIAEAQDAAFTRYATEAYSAISRAGNITAYISTQPEAYVVSESDFIFQDENSALLGTDPAVKDMLFNMDRTELSGLSDVNGKTYLYEVAERENSFIPSYDDVADNVLADYQAHTSFQAASDDVYAKIGDKAMSVAEFAKAAAELNSAIVPAPSITRSERYGNLAGNAELVATLFAAKESDVVKYIDPASNMIYIINIVDFTTPAGAIPNEERMALESFLLSAKQADAKKWLVADLKKRYPVEINPMYMPEQ